MALPAPALPTLKEELDRKVFETIEYLVGAVQKGRMTQAQVSASLDTLFMAVSGLADNDFINIITEAQRVVGGDKSPVKRILMNQETAELVVITWTPGEATVTVSKREFGWATGGSVKDCDTPAKAARFVNAVAENFEKKGWVEQ